MGVPGFRDAPASPWSPGSAVDPGEAEEFLRLLHGEHPELGPVEPRLAQVRADIAATGTYVHTPAELTFGARMAWRNAARCIGRLYWRSMLVRDLREVRTADGIAAALADHLRVAGNRDRRSVRPVISIFAPDRPGAPAARVWNEQLIRYAGHRQADGAVVGDPQYADFTEAVQAMGWRGKSDDPFDVLPVVVETPDGGPRWYELPEDAVWEVPITHPEYPFFTELGLRWHAVPAISNMRLSIGGVSYPLAPFNGWYLGTEIGARNLADTDRYDLLPLVADGLALDMSSERTLWRDRALVELNRAVLWSYDRAGARISDHHTESRRFVDHVNREEQAGRIAPADWTWIVPPMSGGTTAVFHRYYDEADLRPNFYLDEEARRLGREGRRIAPPAVPMQRDPLVPSRPPPAHRAPSMRCPFPPPAQREPEQERVGLLGRLLGRHARI